MNKWISFLLLSTILFLSLCSCANSSSPKSVLECKEKELTPGNKVLFGSYTQSASSEEQTAISWIILEKNERELVLLSEYILDCMAFHEADTSITWGDSDICSFLNTSFKNTAFTKEEKRYLIDTEIDEASYSIYLLSTEEAKTYLNEAYTATPTDYAKGKAAYVSEANTVTWWLRDTKSSGTRNLASVSWWSNALQDSTLTKAYGVRPVICISLDPVE